MSLTSRKSSSSIKGFEFSQQILHYEEWKRLHYFSLCSSGELLHKYLAHIDHFSSLRSTSEDKRLYPIYALKIQRIWRRIKHLINDLHWKICKFLTSTFQTIILPEFRVKDIAKALGLNKQSKRLLYLYCHYSFKEKLKFKCKERGIRLLIVSEPYTSQTCGKCGHLDKQASKTHICSRCGTEIDRDFNGARNIAIRTATV